MKAKTTPGWIFPTYPLFVPVHPSKSKPKWLPYGRTPAQVLSLRGESESYFRNRTNRTAEQIAALDHRPDHESTSYPRVINEFTKDDN